MLCDHGWVEGCTKKGLEGCGEECRCFRFNFRCFVVAEHTLTIPPHKIVIEGSLFIGYIYHFTERYVLNIVLVRFNKFKLHLTGKTM